MIRAGVVGWPIGHSLSPVIHGAWIAAAGLDATYEAFAAADEAAFDALIRRGRDGVIRGLNVTAPWKLRALDSADEATETARRAGSANLLVFRDGRVSADSTDGTGVLQALAEQAPDLALAGSRVTLLGAGGAARAAAAALLDAGARVGVINRGVTRARELESALGVIVQSPDDLVAADLVVNALPVDPGVDVRVLKPGAVVMDMTYRPLLTPLLAAARARGLTIVDGLAMLIGQARPSFRDLYGTDAPDIDVRALCLTALEAA
ncbi:MAG: shikimate dehydrogenase [Alphaproteobacteria bacterium]|nr:shikimate dehydrogenase [Alphaproteobacteria bacterium]MBU1527204.1 shikimate dehydrogenase [Alphaproteobacteria bacterium]MBU2118476.1 shikimate dehydrogenase [Alphaproteobacteria bacterium]MBU2351148.1 shikimate dehydrogenase [Alphaproteobacteria bacterium]MBU2382353.1 shikimate dehydrogenase [Alphaproteobacteria bacterium]